MLWAALSGRDGEIFKRFHREAEADSWVDMHAPYRPEDRLWVGSKKRAFEKRGKNDR